MNPKRRQQSGGQNAQVPKNYEAGSGDRFVHVEMPNPNNGEAVGDEAVMEAIREALSQCDITNYSHVDIEEQYVTHVDKRVPNNPQEQQPDLKGKKPIKITVLPNGQSPRTSKPPSPAQNIVRGGPRTRSSGHVPDPNGLSVYNNNPSDRWLDTKVKCRVCNSMIRRRKLRIHLAVEHMEELTDSDMQ